MEKSYCIEYSFLIGEPKEASFSYFEIFKYLQEDEVISETCEGFGTIGISKKNQSPCLILKNGNLIFFDELYSEIRLGEKKWNERRERNEMEFEAECNVRTQASGGLGQVENEALANGNDHC